jgi:hypothetical protein
LWDTGILVNAPERFPVHHVSVVDNSIYGAVKGVRFHGTSFQQTPVCALNRVDPNPPLVDLDQLRPLVGLDQLPGRRCSSEVRPAAAGRPPAPAPVDSLSGSGIPTRTTSSGTSATYQRVDTTPGPRLFVKESDAQPGTGWAPK